MTHQPILHCHNPLCRVTLDNVRRDGNYCSPGCRIQHERLVSKREPTYAPIALYVRAPQPQRKNSSKADRS